MRLGRHHLRMLFDRHAWVRRASGMHRPMRTSSPVRGRSPACQMTATFGRSARRTLESAPVVELPDLITDTGSECMSVCRYGEKLVRGSQYARTYYQCGHADCPARKIVERDPVHGSVSSCIYGVRACGAALHMTVAA